DVSAEAEVSLWDLAALQIIVTEAGGSFSDLSGNPAPDGGNVLCSNGQLHDEVLQLLADGRDAPAARGSAGSSAAARSARASSSEHAQS
ncbi:MAG: inositol monophosphatase family protein, partial [Streptosporangiaceae bacterium]